MTCIEITARRDGFRRCGMAHSSKPTVHDIDAFSAEELEILRNEPQLIVREVDGEEKSKETISKPTVKVKPSDVPPMAIKPENTEELLAAIVEAFDGLDKEKDFTKAGTPRVDSVAAKLGYDVSGEEVATAFEQYSKGSD